MQHECKNAIINKKSYQVLKDEFTIIPNEQFHVLILPEKVGYLERISSLINELTFGKLKNLIYINPSHGGFIPIQCYTHFSNVNIWFDTYSEKNRLHKLNIERNIEFHNCHNIHIVSIEDIYNKNLIEDMDTNLIIMTEDDDDIDWNDIFSDVSNEDLPILITTKREEVITKYSQNVFSISKTNLYLYIPGSCYNLFMSEFHYFLEDIGETGETGENDENDINSGQRRIRILNYDNLIHLCIMVKNAGDQFENILTENLPIIDRWTVLDTGSTDNTIDIVNKMLVGKKKGRLFQEPFINFRDSRNRCLELAGTHCKYTLMLDDTYIIKGDLRRFLTTIRSDQFADSYSLYIKSKDMEYTSNRILKSECKLRYIYRLHEIVQYKNNMNACIPIEVASVNDCECDYMNLRTSERKEYDLKILLEEAEEEPDNSRHYYYIAQTYTLLNKPALAYEYFLKRAYHSDKGYIQERVDSLFEAARIAKYKMNLSWDVCEKLYQESHELDPRRPDSSYFIAMHYYFEGQIDKAFPYFKKAFEIGYPIHCQFSLKPTLSFYFLPKYLAELCYQYNEYVLGQSACELFLSKNKEDDVSYNLIQSWMSIYQHLNQLKMVETTDVYVPKIPYMTIVYDGSCDTFTHYVEYSIKVEMLENKNSQIIVFSPLTKFKIERGVIYMPLHTYYAFISENEVATSVIYNLSEILPATFKANVANVYFHICNTQTQNDIVKYGIIIPIHTKLNKIVCHTDLDYTHFTTVFSDATLREKIVR